MNKREQIVSTSLLHFSEYGYEGTSLNAIAQACGITKPAIYYHFKDKSALYEAVLLSSFTPLAESMEKQTQNSDPIENLRDYIRIFSDYLIEHPQFAFIFSREIAEGGRLMPQSCVFELSRTLNRLSAILQEGKERGIFECENPFIIQMMVVSTLNSYVTTKSLRKRVSSVLTQKNETINPELDDIKDNLTTKIIKALSC